MAWAKARWRYAALRPTLFGVRCALFYGLVVGAYFASPYVNLYFLLLAFLTLQWLFAAYWTVSNMGRVRAEFPGIPMAEAGVPATVSLTVHGGERRRFDVGAAIALETPTGDTLEGLGRLDVVRGTAKLSLTLPELPRGVHRVSGAHAYSSYPFGLLRRSLPIEAPKEVVVYPRAAGVTEAGRTAEDWVRDLMGTSPQKGGDLQPSSLRDRRDGDSMRSVHWRASARRGKLVVQEWEGGSGEGLEIALDRRADRGEFEQALSEITALLGLAKEGKEVLCVRTQGDVQTFGEGHGAWDAALRMLAELEPLPMDGPPLMSISPSTPVLPRRTVHA